MHSPSNIRLHDVPKRIIAVTLIFVVLAHVIACASVPKSQENWATIRVPAYDTNGRYVSVSLGASGQPTFRMSVPPGRYPVQIAAEWSNGWEDGTSLNIDVEGKKDYLVFAYELKPRQDPADAKIQLLSDLEMIGRAMVSGAGAGALEGAAPLLLMAIIATLPIWLPIWWKCDSCRKPPQGRPFQNCCFIWIEEGTTGKVVAGTRPTQQPSP